MGVNRFFALRNRWGSSGGMGSERLQGPQEWANKDTTKQKNGPSPKARSAGWALLIWEPEAGRRPWQLAGRGGGGAAALPGGLPGLDPFGQARDGPQAPFQFAETGHLDLQAVELSHVLL